MVSSHGKMDPYNGNNLSDGLTRIKLQKRLKRHINQSIREGLSYGCRADCEIMVMYAKTDGRNG
jgi:hypothetical protein